MTEEADPSMADRLSGRPFGAELRRLRGLAGLSLTGLGRGTHYSPSYLSKIENGQKMPTVELARRCDAVLGAHGALSALVPAGASGLHMPEQLRSHDVWTTSQWPDGGFDFATGGAFTGLMSWAPVTATFAADDPQALSAWRLIFDQLRQLGQAFGPSQLVPILAPTINVLRTIATRMQPQPKRDMLILASRFADYTGWMAQEKGDEQAALWWTRHASDLAEAGEDDEMIAYAYVRRALIALYRHDPIQTIALAEQAQVHPHYPRVLALAAQREAQGHAIAGNDAACRRALDRAAAHMSQTIAVGETARPLLGTTQVRDPVAMTTGWCLHELGRSRQATDVLSAELDRIPLSAERSRARYGSRLALALASVKELDQACTIIKPIVEAIPRLDSATIRSDLGSLARTLNRWHAEPVVRSVMPSLHEALRTDTGTR